MRGDLTVADRDHSSGDGAVGLRITQFWRSTRSQMPQGTVCCQLRSCNVGGLDGNVRLDGVLCGTSEGRGRPQRAPRLPCIEASRRPDWAPGASRVTGLWPSSVTLPRGARTMRSAVQAPQWLVPKDIPTPALQLGRDRSTSKPPVGGNAYPYGMRLARAARARYAWLPGRQGPGW